MNTSIDDPEALAKAMKDALALIKTKTTDLDEIGKDMKGRLEKGEAFGQKLQESFDKQAEMVNSLKARYEELEQKAIAATKQQHSGQKSWGQQLVDSDRFADFQEGASGSKTSFRCQIKQIDTVAAGGTAGAGLMAPAYRDGDLVRMPRTELTIEDLLNTINITTSSVDFAKQTVRTNAAAPVAEGAQKPYSNYKWESDTVPVRTLAHLAKLTRQAIMDAPRLVGEVDSEMRYGLGLVKETQYLYGNGVGQNLHGIMPQATAFALPAGITRGEIKFLSRADILRLVMLNIQLRGGIVDGFVVNPVDWTLIELTKDQNGGYMFARPQSGLTTPSLWGQPLVATPAMAAGDFLAGGFKFGATAYRRMGVEVLISTENDVDFELNLATMRAEEMMALAVKRAWTFEKGTFGAAITAVNAAA
jgi:HK97 family phage major capsid protein